MNKEYVLKLIAVIGGLFVAYLWSGGVWEIKAVDDNLIRMNKITGTTYFAYERQWNNIENK